MHRNNKLIFSVFALIVFAFLYHITGYAMNTSSLQCSDSDSGENVFEQGTASGYSWNILSKTGYKQVEYTDKCIPYDRSAKNRVREYYCSEFKVYRKNIACPIGTICVEGACV